MLELYDALTTPTALDSRATSWLVGTGVLAGDPGRLQSGRTVGKGGSGCLARWGVLGFEGSKLLFPGERRRLQQAHAAVPAQDGVVIARGADLFRCGKALQCPLEQRVDRMRQLPGAKLRLGAPLVQKSRIVGLFVAVGQALEGFLGFAAAVGNTARELIGDGKAEQAK